MLVRVASCILNVILDYILVGRLALGIQGSAAATLAVQAAAVMIQAAYFLKLSSNIRFRRFRFDRAVNKATFLNGSSEFIGEMASTISMFTYNYVLMKYVGVQGVAAFTVLGFAVYGYSMVAIGFGQGLTTLVSVSWGGQRMENSNGSSQGNEQNLVRGWCIVCSRLLDSGKKIRRSLWVQWQC